LKLFREFRVGDPSFDAIELKQLLPLGRAELHIGIVKERSQIVFCESGRIPWKSIR
jgi:hypothetical protein